MTHIRSRKHPPGSRAALLSGATLAASLGVALPAIADDAVRDDPATTLDKVEVHGVHSYVASPKFTRSVHDTPQTIQVISRELMHQQGATSLTEALRNTPGVGTFFAGENGNTNTGDTVYMRGFDTSSSIFVDGVRDLGSISRDVFNIEQIEVTKGPAGTDNGRSAPTGAINMVSKQARLQDAASASLSVGDEGRQRATADWSTPLGETSALRLNAMWQDSDVAGRDHVNDSRWGIAPSLGFGLGTDTRYHLNLYYVKQDNVPDGFVPTIGLPGWEPQPGQEALAGHPVDPSNFYGTRQDHDDVEAKMATFAFEHDFSGTLHLSNTLRWGKTEQDYLLSAFMSTGANTPLAPGADPGDLSAYSLVRSNNTFKDQANEILTNQLNLSADFATGRVQHNLSTGLELTRGELTTHNITSTGSRPAANLYDPDWNDTGDLDWMRNGTGSHGQTDTASLYLFDTLGLGDSLLLTAGLRADHYTTEYQSSAICNDGTGRGAVACNGAPVGTAVSTADLETSDTLLNWKLGAVYQVDDAINLYANYALSQQPPGGSNFRLSAGSSNADGVNVDPQKARTFEVGTKWALMGDMLALNLALFRTEVSNEINSELLDEDGNPTQTGEKRVEGVEIMAVGHLSENWMVSAGYTRQQARVEEGAPVTADGSPQLTYTPEDAFTSWTTYRLPFGLTIGGGVRYTGGMRRGRDGAVGTPAFTKSWTVWDAMVSYDINPNLSLRLNGFNLFDKQYVAAINKSGYRYTPGTPRTFLLTADFRF